MLNISLPLANGLHALSNVGLILGTVLALAGTIGAIWTEGLLERFHDERISNNERETADAKTEAEKAKESAAKATERAVNSELALEKLRAQYAWRRLSDSQINIINAGIKSQFHKSEYRFPQITVTSPDAETSQYADDIYLALYGRPVPPTGHAYTTVPTPFSGVAIVGPEDERIVLIKIFRQANIVLLDGGPPNKNIRDPRSEIFVGRMPTPN